MFYYIEGLVSELNVQMAVIDCSGVGYMINTTANTVSRLKKGEKTRLYIYSVIREDCFDLYGFFTLSEKRSFEMLIGVSGVGPKAAVSILSSSTPEALAMAIVSSDEKALTVAQGIGKKIAQRVILELKDKVSKETEGFMLSPGGTVSGGGAAGGSKSADAVAALAVLGYSNSEITTALKGLDIDSMTLEETIKQALKNMMMP